MMSLLGSAALYDQDEISFDGKIDCHRLIHSGNDFNLRRVKVIDSVGSSYTLFKVEMAFYALGCAAGKREYISQG